MTPQYLATVQEDDGTINFVDAEGRVVYTLGSDSPTPPNPNPDPIPAEAAQWISTSGMLVSSNEPYPRAGVVTAWHPHAYTPTGKIGLGYAYTFRPSGTWPNGVSIDPETGVVSVGTPLMPDRYLLDVVVTNRDAQDVSATHQFTLVSDQSLTVKTYNASDYPSFQACCDQVRKDVAAADWGKLRATVLLRRGSTYTYTDNNFGRNISHCTYRATGSGNRPILR